jgi:hypothetical protein
LEREARASMQRAKDDADVLMKNSLRSARGRNTYPRRGS